MLVLKYTIQSKRKTWSIISSTISSLWTQAELGDLLNQNKVLGRKVQKVIKDEQQKLEKLQAKSGLNSRQGLSRIRLIRSVLNPYYFYTDQDPYCGNTDPNPVLVGSVFNCSQLLLYLFTMSTFVLFSHWLSALSSKCLTSFFINELLNDTYHPII